MTSALLCLDPVCTRPRGHEGPFSGLLWHLGPDGRVWPSLTLHEPDKALDASTGSGSASGVQAAPRDAQVAA